MSPTAWPSASPSPLPCACLDAVKPDAVKPSYWPAGWQFFGAWIVAVLSILLNGVVSRLWAEGRLRRRASPDHANESLRLAEANARRGEAMARAAEADARAAEAKAREILASASLYSYHNTSLPAHTPNAHPSTFTMTISQPDVSTTTNPAHMPPTAKRSASRSPSTNAALPSRAELLPLPVLSSARVSPNAPLPTGRDQATSTGVENQAKALTQRGQLLCDGCEDVMTNG
ncbi:hypothetical protein AWENTII_002322 [Aspergillus wentii]